MPRIFKVAGTSEVTDEQLATLLANGDVTIHPEYKIPILSDDYRIAEVPYLVHRWTVEIVHKSVPYYKLFDSLTLAAKYALGEIDRASACDREGDDVPMRVWLRCYGRTVARFDGDPERCRVMLTAVVNAELLNESEQTGT